MKYVFLLLFITLSQSVTGVPGRKEIPSTTEATIATSMMLNRNWKETNHSSLLIALSLRAMSSPQVSSRRITEFQCELAYLRMIDSVWIKNTDRIFFSNIWLLDENSVRLSFSINFTTQLTNTWIDNGKTAGRKWKSGPLLPFSLSGGYGILKKFNPANYINLTFPAYKICSQPNDFTLTDMQVVLRKDASVTFYYEYGASMQFSFDQKIGNARFEHRSNLFCGSSFSDFSFDALNCVSISPFRLLKLKLENRISYEKAISKKLQCRYDFLIGISIDQI